jgi:hypothetical protein
MKKHKNQKHKIYFDDNYFNKSIKPLFFEIARLTVHKNGHGEHVRRGFRRNDAFCRHKNPGSGTSVGAGGLKCPG